MHLEDVFGEDYTRLYCYYHIKAAVKPKLSHLGAELRAGVLSALDLLQLADTEDQFRVAADLLVHHWAESPELTVSTLATASQIADIPNRTVHTIQ